MSLRAVFHKLPNDSLKSGLRSMSNLQEDVPVAKPKRQPRKRKTTVNVNRSVGRQGVELPTIHMPQQHPLPVDTPLEPARIWLEQHAKFPVPKYENLGKSRSSSQFRDARISLVCPNPLVLAFYDPEKAERFIAAVDHTLQDRPLQSSPLGNFNLTNAQVRSVYERLFDPLCKEKDGIALDEWRKISSEATCNFLTFNALLAALKSVTWRLFAKRIHSEMEPLQPGDQHGAFDGTTTAKIKERVDFAMYEEGTDTVILLVEGKTPLVLRGLNKLLTGATLPIDLHDQSGSGRKVLNKLIYYMSLWNVRRLVVTSFATAHIIELHELKSGDIFLSYSDNIDQKTDGSTLFRAMLGMILVKLNAATHFEEFDAEAAYDSYMEGLGAGAAGRARRGGGGGGGGGVPLPGGSSGGGGRTRSSKKGTSDSDKKSSETSTKRSGTGSGQKDTASTDKRGTKRGYKDTIEKPISSIGANGVSRITRTRNISKSMMGPDFEEEAGQKTSVIRLIGSLEIGGIEAHEINFERDAGAPFPSLPTSARVPCLKVLDSKESSQRSDQKAVEGTTGIVYPAVLQEPGGSDIADESDNPTFAIKVIDASRLTYDEYRNSYEDLIKEYKSYYLLALAKRSGRFNDLIDKFTPTCYGLYSTKVGPYDVFALTLDHTGKVDLNEYWTWSESDKQGVMQSLLALHSLGLYHGDAEERNIGVHRDDSKDDTYRFFDFGNSHWHKCPGIKTCEELKLVIRDIYDMQEPPWDPVHFQERTKREYALPFPFCNLEELVDGADIFKYERVVLRLGRLAKKYTTEYYQE